MYHHTNDVSYTKEDSGFIRPSFIAIWVWLGDQGNKRIKTRLGSSNVSTSNIVLQDERQQQKKSIFYFFPVFQELSNFVLYYFSRAAAGSHVGKYLDTFFSFIAATHLIPDQDIHTVLVPRGVFCLQDMTRCV